MRVAALLLTTLLLGALPSARLAWLHPRTPTVRNARADVVSSAADTASPYAAVAQRASEAVLAAVAHNLTRCVVEAFELEDAFEVEAATLGMACARALATDDRVLLLLPDLEAVAAATQAAAASWPERERDRLSIATLAHRGGPDDGCTDVGSVVLCGQAIDDDASELARDASAWLRSASVAVLVNSRAPMLRFEADRYEPIFSIVPHTIRRELLRYEALREVGGFLSERVWLLPPDAISKPRVLTSSGGGGGDSSVAAAAVPTELVAIEDLGVALVSRVYDGPWEVLLDFGYTGSYSALDELPARPTRSELTELVLPNVKARTAALEAALRALRESEQGTEGASVEVVSVPSSSTPTLVGQAVMPAGDVSLAATSDESDGVADTVALRWEQITDGGAEDLALYQQASLLRQRCYGDAVSFGRDELGVHVLQPYTMQEAESMRARSVGYMRLNGDVRGACLLVPDAGGDGIGALEWLAVQRDAEREERSTCAASLLERAVAEAVALRQEWLVVPRLPSQLQVQGANWLAAAGFDPEGEDTPADVRRAMSAGAVCRKVVGRPSV